MKRKNNFENLQQTPEMRTKIENAKIENLRIENVKILKGFFNFRKTK